MCALCTLCTVSTSIHSAPNWKLFDLLHSRSFCWINSREIEEKMCDLIDYHIRVPRADLHSKLCIWRLYVCVCVSAGWLDRWMQSTLNSNHLQTLMLNMLLCAREKSYITLKLNWLTRDFNNSLQCSIDVAVSAIRYTKYARGTGKRNF